MLFVREFLFGIHADLWKSLEKGWITCILAILMPPSGSGDSFPNDSTLERKFRGGTGGKKRRKWEKPEKNSYFQSGLVLIGLHGIL